MPWTPTLSITAKGSLQSAGEHGDSSSVEDAEPATRARVRVSCAGPVDRGMTGTCWFRDPIGHCRRVRFRPQANMATSGMGGVQIPPRARVTASRADPTDSARRASHPTSARPQLRARCSRQANSATSRMPALRHCARAAVKQTNCVHRASDVSARAVAYELFRRSLCVVYVNLGGLCEPRWFM